MKKYDIVIIGAGPAGLATAKSAIEHGCTSVLVIEEHPAIGTPVQCGELFTASIFTDLRIDPEPYIMNELRGVRIHSPSGKVVQLELPPELKRLVFMVERKLFEKRLATMLANRGVTIQTNTRAIGLIIKGGKVEGIKISRAGIKSTLEANIIVGADGPSSCVAKWAGMDVYKDAQNFASGVQYQLAGIDVVPAIGDIYIMRKPNRVIYVAPKGKGFASVGIGALGTGRLDRELRTFIAGEPHLRKGSVIEVNAGVVPLGGMANQLVADNIMLVGDAARQVNPLTGAGVRFAVRAGKMAGEIAARSVEVGDYSKAYLRQYEMRCKQEFGRRFKAFKALRNILFELSDADYEVIFEELSRLTLRKTQIDQIDPWSFLPRAVGSIIVKRPTIAFKLRKILPSLVNK